jgi:hypothetical protein
MRRRASGDSIPGSASSLLPTRCCRLNYHYFVNEKISRSYDMTRVAIIDVYPECRFLSYRIQDPTTTKERRGEKFFSSLFCSNKFHKTDISKIMF